MIKLLKSQVYEKRFLPHLNSDHLTVTNLTWGIYFQLADGKFSSIKK